MKYNKQHDNFKNYLNKIKKITHIKNYELILFNF